MLYSAQAQKKWLIFISYEVASRPTAGRLVRGLDDRLSVRLLADRQE